MSPRRPASLRASGSDQTLHEVLVASAARLIGRRGTVGLTVREIAAESGLAQGVLYNHFGDKNDLIALALHEHVRDVLSGISDLPRPGTATLEANVRAFVVFGMTALSRLLPAFGGAIGDPELMSRFAGHLHGDLDGGIPQLIAQYFAAEQALGRVAPEADVQAAANLIVGACHQEALPALLRGRPEEIDVRDAFVDGLVSTILNGVSPR
jgi:AcrR family transcriptional regulator